MLVLSRFENEVIMAILPDGREIEFRIVEVRENGKIRVGINAPHDVEVHRLEVWNAIKRSGGVRNPEQRPRQMQLPFPDPPLRRRD